MPIPLAQFETDPLAQRAHTLGLQARDIEGDFEKAMHCFNAGVERLYNAGSGMDSPHNLLQLIGIERDAVFTQARIGIREQNVRMVVQGHSAMGGILKYREVMAGMTLDCYEKAAEQRLNAEIGACKGIAARILTVQFVMTAGDATKREKAELLNKASEEYTDAAELLAAGSNRYFEASNAANFARHIRVVNQPGIRTWLGTAVRSTIHAFREDPENAKPALKTTVNRAYVSRSPEAALASVLARP